MRTPLLLLVLAASFAACRAPIASVESALTGQTGFVDPLVVLNEGASASDVAPRAQALATLTRNAPAEEARSWALRGLFDPDDYTRVVSRRRSSSASTSPGPWRSSWSWWAGPT